MHLERVLPSALAVAALCISCKTARPPGPPTVSPGMRPSWITNPKRDDSVYTYRVGHGVSAASPVEAREAAIEDAQRLLSRSILARAQGAGPGPNAVLPLAGMEVMPGCVYNERTGSGHEVWVQVSLPVTEKNAMIEKLRAGEVQVATREPAAPREAGAREIYKQCAPGTVSILSSGRAGTALGSGFFITRDGYLLTNHHVIDDGIDLLVLTAEGERHKARAVDSWPEMDIALLKVDADGFHVLNLADSDAVEIGSPVVAIGTPNRLDYAQSITQGIVSGKRLFHGKPCFQHSALTNKGNSGGPLLDMTGNVVGITSAGLGTAIMRSGVNIGSDIQGINFAVMINLVRPLLDKNHVRAAWR